MTNNPKNRQEWIFDLLKVENTNWTETFGKYSAIFGKSDKTFDKDWKIANERYLEYQTRLNKAKEDISIAIEVEAVETGLKLKKQRQLDLQAMLEPDYRVMETGWDFKNSCSYDYYRPLLPREIVAIQSELSKMAGEYAPTKVANTNAEGEDKAGVSDIQFEKLLNAINTGKL